MKTLILIATLTFSLWFGLVILGKLMRGQSIPSFTFFMWSVNTAIFTLMMLGKL